MYKNIKVVNVGYLILIVLGVLLVFSTVFSGKNRGDGTQYLSENDLSCEGCNVLVIGFDALQANHVSHLGYKKITTPTLDTLASNGVSFSRNFSVASWTVPSFMSYFTSLYPSEHGVVNKFVTFTENEKVISNLKKISPQVLTLADAFKSAGYITGGFTGDAGVNSIFGYGQGFDTYTDETTFGSIEGSASHALSWLDEHQGEKFFMFLHGYDAHGQFSGVGPDYKPTFAHGADEQYEITPERQRELREKGLSDGDLLLDKGEVSAWNAWYDSKIFDADARIGVFLSELEKRNLLESLVVVVISDHGTEIYEHRRFDHGYSLYNELIRVPLVISVPNQENSFISDVQVRSIDLAPTLFDITGITINDDWKNQIRGSSLVPVLTGEEKNNRPVFSSTDYRNYTHKRSYIDDGSWKLIYTLETGESELYNLKDDLSEYKDLATIFPDRVENMKNILFEQLLRTGENVDGKWEIGCLPVYNDQCI
ncbi:sulfatase [Candidatus Kaiserbacteria bacterium]|nr:sulfatase [Candidatus Kaiserbacteria bacterium]